MDTRRPTNLLELDGLARYLCPEPMPIEGTRKIPRLHEDDAPAGKFTVRYSDIDINGHLNSVKYVEHFVDLFDMEQFRTGDIRRFEINYVSEARFGTPLRLYRHEEAPGVFILEMRHEDTLVSAARATWGSYKLRATSYKLQATSTMRDDGESLRVHDL